MKGNCLSKVTDSAKNLEVFGVAENEFEVGRTKFKMEDQRL